jgi:TolA-binding protein
MRHLAAAVRFALLAVVVLAGIGGGRVQAQLTQDQMADLLLNSARKAFNEKNYPFAAKAFREFTQKFGGHKDAVAARYGLALSLIDGPERNYSEARDLFQNLAGVKEFADAPLAVYYAALCARGQGIAELNQADQKPQEAQQRRAVAQQRFNEALPLFTNALKSLSERVKEGAKEPTVEAEWAARARCDLAEMLLRVGKLKEAQATAEPFTQDALAKSQYRNLGRYYHGYASVLLKDHAAGQKSLSTLAPFADPVFGEHARYLLARTHHLADERAEATAGYEGVLADYAKSKTEAAIKLKTPDKLKNDPEERARLEALVRNPAPDHVARAMFYLGVVQYEGGKFGDAKGRLADFVKLFPQSPLKTEAEMRLGFCMVQLKEFGDAIKILTPIVDKEAKLADQVLFWIGKAQVGAAPDPAANLQAHQQAVNNAINTFRQAIERAQRVLDQDPEARTRRGEIFLELADQMQHLKQYREAAGVYSGLINEKAIPDRMEEIGQRLITALHLAGEFNESDKAAQVFAEKHPQSTLLPAVLFVQAENSYFRMLNAEKNQNKEERARDLPKLQEETITRLKKVIEKYPEFAKVQLARYGLGLTHYRMGELEKARAALNDIPAAERGGELALVPYLLGDCLLRQVPNTIPEDALEAGKLEEKLKQAAEFLDAFAAAQSKDPQVADALLKFGFCQQRLAQLNAQPAEKVKILNVARGAYERIGKEFAALPAASQAILERAKCIAQQGDMNGAMNELRRFTNDPLKQSPSAPMALLQLSTYLRSQNKPGEAADVLQKAREQHEANLAKDNDRAVWVALLRYHQGVALREAGKLPEARALFDAVVKMGGNRPEGAEAALRLAQCLKDEGQQKLDIADKLRHAAKKPEEIAHVQKTQDEGYQSIRSAVAFLEGQAEQLKKEDKLQEVRARMLYEAAWGSRTLATPEVQSARAAIAQELAKKSPPMAGKLPLPEVALDKVPQQPSEKKARFLYKTLVDSFPDVPLASEARFELAEMLAQRGEHDEAAKLLNEVLDKEPSAELTEKIRLQLGVIQAAKGNAKGAMTQFDAVALNPKSPLMGWGHYRAAELLIQNQQIPEAIKRLSLFRDQGPLQNLPGLTDRALLRLGYALALDKQWAASQQAYERVANNFSNSPWGDEARYGMGWAMQQQKNYDGAVSAYTQVTTRTAAEVAAKAQFQIGLCRAEQKRPVDAANAFLVVPFTYDYPELSAAALLEAAKSYSENRQAEQAQKLLERIVRDYANTPWAEAAKERMGKN